MTSNFIKKCLEKRHHNDFFMCEVKTGPSWFSRGLGIVDVFVMKKSWVNENIRIYEIKVSRSDFVKDEKWMNYLPFCNEFYFICPSGLIKRDEVGSTAGLCYIYPNSGNIKVIKKAPYKKRKISNEIFRYILMSRLKSDRYPFHDSKLDYWKEWIANKDSARHMSFMIKSKMIERLSKAEGDAAQYKSDAMKFRDLCDFCRSNKICYSFNLVDDIKKLLTTRRNSVTDVALNNICHAIDSLKHAKILLGDKN